MDWSKTEEEKQNAEKVLPRGLEQVSHLFLSHANPPSAPAENASTQVDDQPLTVVSRRFLGREQLLSLLRKQPDALEEGMKAIDANIPCETAGSIELLALDYTNQLSIIELDNFPNDALLLRGLSHFEWIVRNISNVQRMYREQPINPSLQPRLILVAPEFSPLFRSVTRLLTTPRIQCLKYHAFALADGPGVFFERVSGVA